MKEGRNIPNLEALFQVGGHIKFKVIQFRVTEFIR